MCPWLFAIRDTFKGVYDVLKGMDEFLRAIFITGVTKCVKTSVFSGINNLNDILLHEEGAQLYLRKDSKHLLFCGFFIDFHIKT